MHTIRNADGVSDDSHSGGDSDDQQEDTDNDSYNQEGETTIQAPPPVEMLHNLGEHNLNCIAPVADKLNHRSFEAPILKYRLLLPQRSQF